MCYGETFPWWVDTTYSLYSDFAVADWNCSIFSLRGYTVVVWLTWCRAQEQTNRH